MGAVLIQTVGWMTMIPTQLVKTGSVTEAVSNTFDGNHPCEFCKTAERLRAAERVENPGEPEQIPQPTKSWGKHLLTAALKSVPIIRPEEKFKPHGCEAALWWASVTLDLESPPPQGC